VLYDLVGFTGSGLAPRNWRPSATTSGARGAAYPRGKNGSDDHRPAGLLHRARRQPVRELLRDRRLRDYLTREIVPFVDREFRTLASASTRLLRKIIRRLRRVLHGMKYGKYWVRSPITPATRISILSTGTTGRTR